MKIGDIVSIRKAGDVIPEVIEPIKAKRTGTEKPFQMITTCPICHTKLIRSNTGIDHLCPNINCDARKIENLIHFVSRDAMNIEGLGENILTDLYNMGYVKNIVDIYHLSHYKDELISLEGYGAKSVDNLLITIEQSKQNSLERLLFGLGIRHVGKKTAKILAKEYLTMDNLINASYEDLIINGNIGDIISQSIISYFDLEHRSLIKDLKTLNINMKYIFSTPTNNVNKNIKGKTFVITGTLEQYDRNNLIEIIENNDGKTTESVTKNTDVVIVGHKPGSKYDRALALKIEIWDENTLIDKLKEA